MGRTLAWTDAAWDDYLYWQEQDKKTLKRINKLLAETKRSPFEGIGKPEALKENLSGFWSRRIDESHRLVYAVDETPHHRHFLSLSLLNSTIGIELVDKAIIYCPQFQRSLRKRDPRLLHFAVGQHPHE